MKKINHLITNLAPGGTEFQLLEIVKETRDKFCHQIFTLKKSDTKTLKKFKELDIKVVNLNIFNPFYFIFYSLKELIMLRGEILSCWLYHGCFIGLLVDFLLNRNSLMIWNIRSSVTAIDQAPWHRKLTFYLLRKFSKRPKSIIYNSEQSFAEHNMSGYDNENQEVIENGVNTERFTIDDSARNSFCQRYKIDERTFLIGMSARFHPIKDHFLLIEVAIELLEKDYDIMIIFCGSKTDLLKNQIKNRFKDKKLDKKILCMGHVDNLNKIYAAMDVHVLTSSSESSSNAVAEAMSCGTLSLSTDVGNSRKIIGEDKLIVGLENNRQEKIQDLSNKIERIIKMNKEDLLKEGLLARERIKNFFSSTKTINSFEKKFLELS